MKKKINLSMLVTTLVCLLPIILAIILYPKLPSEIPTHFNWSGEADRYTPKAIACFGMPIGFAVLNLFVHFIIDADPKRKNISKTMKMATIWLIPILSVTILPMSLFISMGIDIQIQAIIPTVVGIIIIICGNYLPKSRQNYTVGIKIPWTLNNEENWNKTHRLAGFLWVLCGFLIVIASIFGFLNTIVLLFIVSILVVIPYVYSYILYRRGL